jgi:hypothetical protein
MKALTLTQPWATLVAIGAKRIETRSWRTSYRGPLAIHAAKGLASVGGKRGLRQLIASEPFATALAGHSWLPLGAIIATCTPVDCVPTEQIMKAFGAYGPTDASGGHKLWPLTDQELTFGDYSANRWGWLLDDVQMLDTPVFCKGALGLWEWQQ